MAGKIITELHSLYNQLTSSLRRICAIWRSW